jgi:hypothetical protein
LNSAADAQVTPTPKNIDPGLPSTTSGSEAAPSNSPATPAIVKVGFLVNDIQDIDLEQHRYQIDFYIWYQWNDPELDPAA